MKWDQHLTCLSHRVVLEEYMTPLILDKEEEGDDADDHGAGDADDNHHPAVHLASDPDSDVPLSFSVLSRASMSSVVSTPELRELISVKMLPVARTVILLISLDSSKLEQTRQY